MAAWHNLNFKQMLGYRRTSMDPDEAAIAPEEQTWRTPDYIKDSRVLLEREKLG